MKKRLKEEGKADLTTVAIKKTTRDKLDNLGFDRHASYDSIISSILEKQKEWKTTSEMIAELAKEIHEIHDIIVMYKPLFDTSTRLQTMRQLRDEAEQIKEAGQKVIRK